MSGHPRTLLTCAGCGAKWSYPMSAAGLPRCPKCHVVHVPHVVPVSPADTDAAAEWAIDAAMAMAAGGR